MPDIYIITREYSSEDYYRFKVLDQYYLDRDTAIKRLHEKVDACESIIKRSAKTLKMDREKTDICDKIVSLDSLMGHEERIFRLERLSQYEEKNES